MNKSDTHMGDGRYKVTYGGGESRYGAESVDYMLVEADGMELYAEAKNDTWNDEKQEYDDDNATYEELKAKIIEQAVRNGIDASLICFD